MGVWTAIVAQSVEDNSTRTLGNILWVTYFSSAVLFIIAASIEKNTTNGETSTPINENETLEDGKGDNRAVESTSSDLSAPNRFSEQEIEESETKDTETQQEEEMLTEQISAKEVNLNKEERPRSQVFISYSHKDNVWLDRLQTHLKPFIKNNKLVVFDDTKIKPGSRWKDEIEKALAATKVAVLLVSPNFLASEFIDKNELPPLLAAAEKEGLIILWLLLRTCGYKETEIAQYQAVLDPKKPLVKVRESELDDVFNDICEKIKEAVRR